MGRLFNARRGWLLPLGFALLGGCGLYTDQLGRAEGHYQTARYEAAMANLEDIEVHFPELGQRERVRYDYVRGMTHLRLSQRPAARHWLAMAREDSNGLDGALSDSQRATIERTLTDLDPLNPHSSDTPSSSSPPPLAR